MASIFFDGKSRIPRRRDVGLNFVQLFDQRMTRTTLQIRAQRLQLLGGSRGVDLHAAVYQILHVSGEPQLLGNPLGKETIPYALHSSGNVKSLGFRLFHHSTPPPRVGRNLQF